MPRDVHEVLRLLSFGRAGPFVLRIRLVCGGRLQQSTGFNLGSSRRVLEALDLVPAFLNRALLTLNRRDQGQYQWRLLGDRSLDPVDL